MPNDPNAISASADVQLMARIASGDKAAFEQLYQRFGGPLFNLARSVVRSSAEADDVRQEVFQEVWKRAGDYRASLGSPFSWIMTITRHKAIDRLRFDTRRLKNTARFEAEVNQTEAARERGADRRVMAEETGSAVRGALDSLSQCEREAIELAYFEGLSSSQVAERLHVPLGTVKARVRRALRHLQRPLSGWR